MCIYYINRYANINVNVLYMHIYIYKYDIFTFDMYIYIYHRVLLISKGPYTVVTIVGQDAAGNHELHRYLPEPGSNLTSLEPSPEPTRTELGRLKLKQKRSCVESRMERCHPTAPLQNNAKTLPRLSGL